MNKDLKVEVITAPEVIANTNLEKAIYDLDNEIENLTVRADKLDYFISISSGIVCGMLDILWVGEFSLEHGRNIAESKFNALVEKTAALFGCNETGLKSAVSFLEKKFPIPSDGNTPEFGGGLQHHLRDFAHHPTIIGLIFSLLTQFTEKSYGTDVSGKFIIVPVPEKSRVFIGDNFVDKIIKGTLVWFFHLISDVAGSSSTAGRSGGTGIPGPILSLAKEISVLPLFRKIKIGNNSLNVFLSKLFNGTLLAKHDKNGRLIKGTEFQFDFRGELGIAIELSRQSLPVIANECIVRSFYFVRRLASSVRSANISSVSDMQRLDWDNIKPANNSTITRMITIATGVFTTIDITEAFITKKYFVSVNYVGVGRFAVALGSEMTNFLKLRDVKRIKQFYEDINRNTYTQVDNATYKRMGETMNIEKFGLTMEQTEILYNLEMYKTINDINSSHLGTSLKAQWLEEWKYFMSVGFPDFVNISDAKLHWYKRDELIKKIQDNSPENIWFRLVLLEAMVFEPYYPLSTEFDKNGHEIPSSKYKKLSMPLYGFDKSNGDDFLDAFYTQGYIKRLRKCYDKVLLELNEVLKTVLKSVSITAAFTVVALLTAGMFAPAIAVALVGSNFAGLSGAALTSACLAYLGGGAIAAGGLGMAGGTMAIVGGGAVLGLGVGAGVGGTVGAVSIMGQKGTILQSAKLMVSVREIFLNDEHDIDYSDSVYEQYVKNIADIEKELVELKLKRDVSDKAEKKKLEIEIKNIEQSVHVMQIAMKSMHKYNSSFAEGYKVK